nr:isocitrate dehydrogenase [NAD] regulatory subunit 1, mitochondrial-like [Tanacetum cinerariifolium]
MRWLLTWTDDLEKRYIKNYIRDNYSVSFFLYLLSYTSLTSPQNREQLSSPSPSEMQRSSSVTSLYKSDELSYTSSPLHDDAYFSETPKTPTTHSMRYDDEETKNCKILIILVVKHRIMTQRRNVLRRRKRNKVCLKGGLVTPVGGGVSSLNVEMRKELDLFVNVVHCCKFEGLKTRHEDVEVDVVVVRENTEGEYSGLEHEVVPGVIESLKRTSAFKN